MKIDGITTFCSMMETYSQDPDVKLPELPSIINNYLKNISSNPLQGSADIPVKSIATHTS